MRDDVRTVEAENAYSTTPYSYKNCQLLIDKSEENSKLQVAWPRRREANRGCEYIPGHLGDDPLCLEGVYFFFALVGERNDSARSGSVNGNDNRVLK
jgi:hypothetical protein